PPQRHPRRDRPAVVEFHHSPHRPRGERASARAARPHRRCAERGRAAPAGSRRSESPGMIAGLPLGFAEPLVLIGLLTLPALWWLLRLWGARARRGGRPAQGDGRGT